MINGSAKGFPKSGLSLLALSATIALGVGLSESSREDFRSAQKAFRFSIDRAKADSPAKDLLMGAYSAWAARPFDLQSRSAVASLAVAVDIDDQEGTELRRYALASALMAANRTNPDSVEMLLKVLIAVLHAERNSGPPASVLNLAKRELANLKKSALKTDHRSGFVEYAEARIAIVEKKFDHADKLLQQAAGLAPNNPIYAVWSARLMIQNGRKEEAQVLVRQHLNKQGEIKFDQTHTPLFRYIQKKARHHLELLRE